jgi:nondiscriminating aspartyl-tRNA synthetase
MCAKRSHFRGWSAAGSIHNHQHYGAKGEIMERKLIKFMPQCIGEKVRIAGFVERVRELKTVQFIILQDGSGSVQVTNVLDRPANSLEQETGIHIADEIRRLTPGSAVEIFGTVSENSAVKLYGLEIVPSCIITHSLAEAPLPFTSNAGQEERLDWRFLDLRSERNRLIFEVQTATEHAMRLFWRSEGFLEIHSPKLMGSPSESGAELFEVKYFDRIAYLAQSPQFYKQMAMAAGFGKVFEIGPVFRANPSFTTRHDTEFTGVDIEISWIESHEDVMQTEERWIRSILSFVKGELGPQIEKIFGVEVVVPTTPFPRIPMAEAYTILEGLGHEIQRGDKGDLDPEGERLLSRHVREKFGHEFVFVTDYPTGVRPFYHMRHVGSPELTKSFDLLWKGLEITTGAQREHRYEVLLRQAEEKQISQESIRFYLDFFRFGCPPHGGYGFGLTRFLMTLLGLKNVREATYVYRGVNRLTP